MKDIQYVLRPFFSASGVGQEALNFSIDNLSWKLGGSIATADEIAVLKRGAISRGATPAFIRIIDLMEQGNDSAQDYASALKAYFAEVGLYV